MKLTLLTQLIKKWMLQQLRPDIEALLAMQVDAQIREITRLVPIADIAEHDVHIVGYPKSGNTWFQSLAAGVIYGVNPETLADVVIQTWIPDVHYHRYYRRFHEPMYFKSHELPSPIHKRVVYLLRDGRDVMVSYFHHVWALSGHRPDFLRLVADGHDSFPCKWTEHVQRWLLSGLEMPQLIIRYEDLKKDPIRQLERFCEFAGVERSRSLLESVSRGSSIDVMRRKENSLGWIDNENGKRWPTEMPFVRRGKVGSYIDEMPPDVLSAFMEEAHSVLERVGYQ